ncbi:MAG: SDR family oxidoreductase [FCB group bacterium]|jgi:NAD(P)-dependent dehydrogenase (short-subunit alcohol dehydrogenase family)
MNLKNLNAVILGSSSGFGRASAMELARMGYNIYGIHLDTGANKKEADRIVEELRCFGVRVRFFNQNAADESKRREIINTIKDELAEDDNSKIRVLMHSLAFGTIGPLISANREDEINKKRIEMTMNVMANSLLYWAQDIFHNQLFAEDSRIIALTSSGSNRAMKGYGAVSVAKAALESFVRQLAVELAPFKITVNALMPGVTDTPAAQKLPDFPRMLKFCAEHHPYDRNTFPQDVAKAIALIIDEKSYWITGQTIGVDGGESIYSSF